MREEISDILIFEDDEFNAVLSLGGPLSHVLDKKERSQAVSGFSRVSGDDSPVLISVMSFHGVLLLQSRMEWDFIGEIQDFYESQKYDEKLREKLGEEEPGFADTYFFKKH